MNKRYSDNPVDQSKDFKESGMRLITDTRSDVYLEMARKQKEEEDKNKE